VPTPELVVITGANAGIGRATAAAIARQGSHVVLLCRSKERTLPVIEAIRQEAGHDRVEMRELDLASLASVRRCANEVLALDRPIDVLINNAGLAGHRGQTEDGFELHFGTNHLGHYLLTYLLLPAIRAAHAPRIVTVASRAHARTRTIDFDAVTKPTRTVTGFHEYAVSKLANVAFNVALAERLDGTGIHTYALHPGVVASEIWRRVPPPLRQLANRFMITNEQGAQTSVWCATSPDAAHQTGLYYDKCAPKQTSRHVTPQLVRELWDKSAEWTGVG
jgi:retinol dehydrogenase-12